MAVGTDLVNAIVSQLNGANFSPWATAERVAMPRFKLEEVSTLKIPVVGRGFSVSTESRRARLFEYMVDVGFIKHVQNEQAEVETLKGLVEDVANYLMTTDNRSPPAYTGAILLRCTTLAENSRDDSIFDVPAMQQDRRFLSVLSLVYRVVR